ncbi:hypothetical protein M427DRAFT_113168 [Gonapodya prolifera JEL478]|uniref:Uncharacterized protein n=1 Tax=Gonapodya prolifera (strain JEL478) TaxID=1344416 RepID=A0A139AA03_GONPJ|nr:hypothetical protein M427DRAFT_113168 [Gonapodya prolifera JEL478]|eukprot:KXS13616.1 hypothetical protein M427DRAFT_113168 [Gonapodya prolifera JEL478]
MEAAQTAPPSTAMNGGVATGAGPFSQDQIDTLRRQIFEFRRISRGLPLESQATTHSPKALTNGVTTSPQSHSAAEPSAVSSPLPNGEQDSSSQQAASSSSDAPKEPQFRINKDSNPFALLPRPVSHALHAATLHRTLIPAIAPPAVDPAVLARERERRLQTRIQARIRELEKLPLGIQGEPVANLTLDPENRIATASQLKLRAVAELKALKLLPLQREIRHGVLMAHTRSSSMLPLVSLDRAALKRPKRPSIREARSTERLERQQRVERERKDKARQLEFVEQVAQQAAQVKGWHRARHARMQRLGQAVIKLHARVEKEEQARVERNSKERLRALREDDEEAYLKLVESAKDTRITSILNQTSQFLKNLSAQVLAQQKAIADGEPIELDEESLLEDDEEDAGDPNGVSTAAQASERRRKAGKLDYYGVAHRVVESVTAQPDILSGGRLKEYQLKGLEWMVSLYNNRLNGILADEMGLGKTIQTISLISYLVERKRQPGPFLVIVPLSTLTNWALEFEKWAPSITKIVYKGPPAARKALQYELRGGNFNVLLTTYQFITNDKDRPSLSRIKWVYMIIDEGHRMKNSEAKLVQILTQNYSSRYRLILTGTPLQNNLPELWSLLNFICPKIFDSVKTFDEWFNSPFKGQAVGGMSQDNVALNEEEQLLIIKRLHKVLRPFLLRRLKKDVEAQLPGKSEKVIKCQFSFLQQRLYDQIKRHGVLPMVAQAGKSTSGVKGLRNTLMHLRKVCNHPFAFQEVRDAVDPAWTNKMLLYRVSGKFELLDRLLPKFFATGHKVLMFFQMTLVMDVFEEFCAYRGINVLRLDGHTKHEDRAEMMRRFNDANDTEFMLFILSTRAGGLGLNLQVADTVIIFDSDWNPHQDLQAQDRAHRIGQTKEVKIFRLVTVKSVEENILARAQFKLDMDSKVIQAGKFDNKSTNEEREEFLRSLLGGGSGADGAGDGDEDEANDGADAEEETTSGEYLLDIIARNDEEKELFRAMDREMEERDALEWKARGQPSKGRFIQPDEVPEIFLKDQPKVVKVDNPHTLGRGRRKREGATLNENMLAKKQWEDSDGSDEGEGSDGTEDTTLSGDKGKRKDDGDNANRKRRFQELADEDDEADEMFIDGGRSVTEYESVQNSEGDEGRQDVPRKRGRPKKVKLAGEVAAGGGGLKIKFNPPPSGGSSSGVEGDGNHIEG